MYESRFTYTDALYDITMIQLKYAEKQRFRNHRNETKTVRQKFKDPEQEYEDTVRMKTQRKKQQRRSISFFRSTWHTSFSRTAYSYPSRTFSKRQHRLPVLRFLSEFHSASQSMFGHGDRCTVQQTPAKKRRRSPTRRPTELTAAMASNCCGGGRAPSSVRPSVRPPSLGCPSATIDSRLGRPAGDRRRSVRLRGRRPDRPGQTSEINKDVRGRVARDCFIAPPRRRLPVLHHAPPSPNNGRCLYAYLWARDDNPAAAAGAKKTRR